MLHATTRTAVMDVIVQLVFFFMRPFLLVLALASSTTLLACDVCGCSIAGGGFGLLSGTTQHFVGVSYTHLQYENEVAPVVDHFNRFQLTGQVQIKRRWRAQAVIPIVLNTRFDERAAALQANGIGDIQLLGSYALVDRLLDKGGRLLVTSGLGISLPTGAFDRQIFRRPLPEDFNPGRGAATFIGEVRVQATKGNHGVLSVLRHETSSHNEANYRFGDRWLVLAKAYRRIKTKHVGLVPSLGLEYAHIAPNARRETGTELHGSGGNTFNISSGLQAERNNYAFGIEAALPITQTFGNGDALATPRLDVTLIRKF